MLTMFLKQIRRLSSQAFGYSVATRKSHQKAKLDKCPEFEPVHIDVPWGTIEAKLWNFGDKQPLLAVHGWMDNAGSFDNIAPLLKHSSVLAIDLPGHGLSSWMPKGFIYTDEIFVKAIRTVVKKFGWKKTKLLGHSLGGLICYNYARLFPDETQFVVSIDCSSLPVNNIFDHTKTRAQYIDKCISFEEMADNPPSYPEDVIINKWMKGLPSLDTSSTRTLMIRGTKRKDDGTYYFTRDIRLTIINKGCSSCYTLEMVKEMTQLITCPYMIINIPKTIWARYFVPEAVDAFKAKNSDFYFTEMNGNHHLHMIRPEEVANVINPFLEKYDN